MGFLFERRARSRKSTSGLRSWFAKAPDAREVRDRLGRLLPRALKGAAVQATAKRVTAKLHPFAPPVTVEVEDDAAIVVRGDASTIGPAYIEDALARLAPVLEELEYAWDGDAPDYRAAALAWVVDELRAGATSLGMPKGRRFAVAADEVQTPLGPRGPAWRAAVLEDPSKARDVFPWWDRAPGHADRARALLALWHEVPWREAIDDAERALLRRVDGELRAAREANADLALPYAAWAEVAKQLDDLVHATELKARADADAEAHADAGAKPIGYRHYDVDVEIEGWLIRQPGSFLGKWEPDDNRYWAADDTRSFELMTIETTEGDSQALLSIAPPLHAVIAEEADGERRARAEAYDDDDVHVVHGLVTTAPHVAILTCKASAADEPWALATWRSLRRA